MRPRPRRHVLETIEIPDVLTVQELATSMIVPAKDVIKELIKMGTMATINQNIPATVAQNVAKKFGFNAVIKEAGEEVVVEQEEDRPELLSTRPPVVTVLGHVDHGKTSLLDKIRSADVAAGEAGGITQRIGAYTVERNDRKITFIDTPGHEAFTAMRARGAKVTDVAILVVAADDGVMPQTIEAISHIKAAGVPIVVAINKMDRENAQPDRVKSQLSEQGLQPVDWGGTIEMVPVSARTGDGIDQLLETVLLEADIRDLKANKTRRAQGVVIESALDKGRGAVATVLVQNGTLRTGDVVVVGSAYGKIRALMDDKGKQVKKAGPSIPVEIMGLSDVPSAGDALMVVSDERVAREAAAKRSSRRQKSASRRSSGPRISLESSCRCPPTAAARRSTSSSRPTVKGRSRRCGRGSKASRTPKSTSASSTRASAGSRPTTSTSHRLNAVLIGFNIRPDETVKRLAENEQVDLRFYHVIYEVENDLKKAMVGMLAPKFREVILGRAEVREVFKVSKVGTIAGCYVQSGKLTRNAKVRILRDRRSCSTANSSRCGASRTTFAKLPRSSSAAFRSRGTRISSRAISSKRSRPSSWLRKRCLLSGWVCAGDLGRARTGPGDGPIFPSGKNRASVVRRSRASRRSAPRSRPRAHPRAPEVAFQPFLWASLRSPGALYVEGCCEGGAAGSDRS